MPWLRAPNVRSRWSDEWKLVPGPVPWWDCLPHRLPTINKSDPIERKENGWPSSVSLDGLPFLCVWCRFEPTKSGAQFLARVLLLSGGSS